jgi:hypothetical protein
MSNIIRYILPEDIKANIQGQKSFRPYVPNVDNEERNLSSTNHFTDFSNPHRARFVQISDPRLRQLRAAKLSPKERDTVSRGILEQLLYLAESRLEL